MATQHMLFTPSAIDKLKLPATGRTTFYDTKVSELGLRVDANGRKSFFWFKTANNQPVFRALGTWPAIGIAQARIDARDLQNKLETWRKAKYVGPNPFDGPEHEPTFQELLDAYVAKRVMGHATNPARAKAETEWMVSKYLSGWTSRRLSTISDRDVRKRHGEIAEKNGKTIADRVIQLARRLFAWGIDKEKIFGGPNPAKGVEFYGSQKRERFLSGDELARLFAEMKKDSNRDLVDFVNLSLWTGARRGDVQSMRWQDLSLDDNTWRIPTPKGGKPYLLPLVPEAVAILKARQRLALDGAVWVFPTTGRLKASVGHLVELRRGWSQLLKRARIEDLHFHDLRRTLASWQAGLGYSLPVIGRSLGHAAGSTATSVYARLDLSVVRGAMGGAVDAMVAASKAKPKTPRKSRKPAQPQLPAHNEAAASR